MAVTPTFTRTPHLVDLIAEAEHLSAMLTLADPAPAADLWRDAAMASLAMDGSTIPAPPSEADLEASRSAEDLEGLAGTVGWADAMDREHDEAPDATDLDRIVWAREYQGVIDAVTADDLADRLLRDPLGALATLHGTLTRGLTPPEHIGALRRSDQAVHDAATGRIVYFATDPSAVAAEVHGLAGWVASAGAREHGLLLSGVVHAELLRIHPFESANGRLARAAARLLLRGRALDPHGLAVPELALQADALGTYEEVARTARRRDHTIWLERWGEAVTSGLRTSAIRLGMLDPEVPARARDFVHERTGRFTVIDYRGDVGVEPPDARADLERMLDAGVIRRVLGGRGLVFEVVEHATAP